MRTDPHAERGVAVITALLIMAIAAAAASMLAWQEGIWFRQVNNVREQSQAADLAAAGVDWARGILVEDARRGNVDYLGEAWARTLGGLPVENGQLGGNMIDEQGRFNLNNLVQNGQISLPDMAIFQRLLNVLHLPAALGDDLVSWMGAAQTGAPAPTAAAQSPSVPAQVPGRQLMTVNTLYRIPGFDAASVKRLFPFVSALPGHTAINVNTAPPEVLAALLGLSVSQVQDLIQTRKDQPFTDPANFRERLPPNVAVGLNDQNIGVGSQFFLVNSIARVGRLQVAYRALLQRQGPDKWPTILWRVRGGA